MTIKKYSLLPDNASLLERGLELAFHRLLYEINSPFPDLLNPKKTKLATLPALANERGVLEWDNNAAKNEQRQTVKNAWLIRRYAGTKIGIALALDSLLHDAIVTPWYNDSGEPYTFKIEAFRRDNAPINNSIIQRMYAHLDHAKSERDSYELVLVNANNSSLAISGACSTSIQVDEIKTTSEGFNTAPLTGSINFLAGHHILSVTDDFPRCIYLASIETTIKIGISAVTFNYIITEI